MARVQLTLACEQDNSLFLVVARGHPRVAREDVSARSDYEDETRVRGVGKERASFPFPPALTGRFARHKWRACSQANLTPKRCHYKTGNPFVSELFIPLMTNVAIDNTRSWSSPPTQYDSVVLCFKCIPK